ncbi:hypothetical protein CHINAEXTREME_01270 [Halobiforma lacisalsi AJ5]|uniref:DUF3179 domain-containing protein n=1 Tax=Natronobacterium lacisalsi AJ5 TaxID=358396 RepID=A0A1P8LL08_NATLA|nr:DUF3179 domain-containing protein [Halobiforma lacisalsi]APW96478.1 hypothetical protein CHINAEXTREME_01270 [Halobiforma lacisalsi AJ5]
MTRRSRRSVLALAAVGLAGCLGGSGPGRSGPYDEGEGGAEAAPDGMTASPDEAALEASSVPTADEQLPVEYSLEALREATVREVVPRDGIPSIDDPAFEPVDESVDRLPDDPVFGVVRNGEAKAYPQSVLVHHEIVNDEIGGEPVAVTYCPLTGTAMGFERGDVEFGVSGHLLNSNLVMYDRDGESYWPQMLATAMEGPLEAASLVEFPVRWTTWERWTEAYPDSVVLASDQDYIRDYGNDPYGAYNPPSGYYAEDTDWTFAPLTADDRYPPKRPFLCSRSDDGPLAISLEALREEGVYGIGGDGRDDYLATYDPTFDVGHLYRVEDATEYGYDADAGAVIDPNGERRDPADLPLESVYAYDAMWFAWAGFYPSTSVHTHD